MFRIDHHLHTSRHSPDSLMEPEDLLVRAREVGLDGIIITEHDYQWTPEELEDLRSRADGLVVLAGVEVSAREGHFLVYGLPDLDEAPPGIGLGELVRVVRRHGAAIVAAHPFRWGQDFAGIVAEHGAVFDALELVSNNVSPETRRRAEGLLAEHPMGATGSSDGHDLGAVGCYFSGFARPIATIEEFVVDLKRRECRPGHRPGARLSAGPIASVA